MMRNLSHYLSLFVILVTLVTVSACRPDEVTEEPVVTDGSPTIEVAQNSDSSSSVEQSSSEQQALPTLAPPSGALTIWHSWAQQDGDALQQILETFKQRYPEITVETLFVADSDLLQSYAQAVAEGGGPDLILAPNWWLEELKVLGVIDALADPNFAATSAAVLPAAAANLRMDGELYGMPLFYETVALYYNKALLGDTALPRSLTELAELASADPTYGIGLYASPFHLTWGFPAFGASVFNANGHSTIADTPDAAQFLRFLTQLNDLPGSYVDGDYGMLLDRFKKGEFAFFVDGPWAMDELQRVLGDDLGVAEIPPGPAGVSRPWLYADAIYVNPNLPDARIPIAALFVEHMTSAESGEYLADIAHRLPVSPNADLPPGSLLQGFAQEAANADGMPHGPEMDAFWRYGGDMFFKALSGEYDAQAVVDETAALINDTTGK